MGPWEYEVVDDVRAGGDELAHPQAVEKRGLLQIAPCPLRDGRLLVWHHAELTGGMSFGTRREQIDTAEIQHLPPRYQQAIVSPDGSLAAFHDWLSPASIAVTDALGVTIARTTFPRLDCLIALDAEAQTLTLRGRTGFDSEQSLAELNARPQLSLWTWHWRSDSWSETPAIFHGYRDTEEKGRRCVGMRLDQDRDIAFALTTGLDVQVLEERPEEELIIVNDAVHRVHEGTGDSQTHPLRPLLLGRLPTDIKLDARTTLDRAWISEPGGCISGYVLHNAERVWRIQLPHTDENERAARISCSSIEGLPNTLVVRADNDRVYLIDAESGTITHEITIQAKTLRGSMRPVRTHMALLFQGDGSLWGWQIP